MSTHLRRFFLLLSCASLAWGPPPPFACIVGERRASDAIISIRVACAALCIDGPSIYLYLNVFKFFIEERRAK